MSAGGQEPALDGAYAHCEAVLRESDHAAWLAALFAPADRRPGLHALGTFAFEAAGIRRKVREPMAGELRFQWWIDAIEGDTRGDVTGHPVALALLDTVQRRNLSGAALTGFLEARRAELYDEPVPDLSAFLLRADETEGALVAARLAILTDRRGPDTEAASRHAGRVVAVLQSLRDLARSSGRSHHTIPVALLQAHGVEPAGLASEADPAALGAALRAFAAVAAEEMAALRRLRAKIDPAAKAAFLEASLAGATLRRVTGRNYRPFQTDLALPQWRAQWLMWRAAGKTGIL